MSAIFLLKLKPKFSSADQLDKSQIYVDVMWKNAHINSFI